MRYGFSTKNDPGGLSKLIFLKLHLVIDHGDATMYQFPGPQC